MRYGKFYGVGVGPGDPGLVTLKAVKCLQNADVIFSAVSRQGARSVSGNVVDSIPDIEAECHELVFSMSKDWNERLACVKENARLIADELERGKNCAFTTIGDPMTYSTCGYLVKFLELMLDDLRAEFIPGVNSWSALAAASGRVLVEDCERFTVQPNYIDPDPETFKKALADGDTLVFLKTYRSRNKILDLLAEEVPDAKVTYGANIGLPEQFISKDPDKIRDRKDEYLSMLIVNTGKGCLPEKPGSEQGPANAGASPTEVSGCQVDFNDKR
ncbi:precorrin-2 C(20)-methyltransferase [Lentisphaerota bacterium ZTH]|nr:precorrin-2 C(20)-methyltransferase [Lentisphaerota bacterium]WET07549.1 precorrin-2 C(20)-methyltransferase [Lentisphaerota bacterium ZTH]